MGHLHLPIMTKPRHSAERKGTGGDSTAGPLLVYDFDLSYDHLPKKIVTVFTKLVEMFCFTFLDLRLVAMHFSLC
jgi:hypothetical protein